MQLLSDARAVRGGSCSSGGVAGERDSSCYYLFPSQEALDTATLHLSATSWDSTDKEVLATTRAEITRLVGFEQEADAIMVALRASQSGTGTDVGFGAVLEDELDSYEALVRDAGNVNQMK